MSTPGGWTANGGDWAQECGRGKGLTCWGESWVSKRVRAGARVTRCWAMRARASLPAAGEDALRR